jgi:hypothetical protein
MMNIERTWQVAAGDVLCDIETDKATLDFESLEDGYALFTHIEELRIPAILPFWDGDPDTWFQMDGLSRAIFCMETISCVCVIF